ncbi:MAG TPA: hypothetical protein HPP64_13715 [Gammaproteobacteria bacterium]|jgi:type I restriction enzyme S subunit|nr:hypothetical protein [Gammaproteobacteria bacterium]MBT6651524.1 hypothetical protein [Gammaproteobacteria bacterium]MBT6880531.1 hypothetical protein [Gammaproteobacteria bacterium]MBT7140297.1 hypothetical protein [Gammaproteobacteria bacterium]HIJ23947.1 hypothetical protein [Gammaproteobacteria bacterium]
MGLQLQKYSGYQQTDLPWLDEVPAHWCLIRKKYLFEERVQKGYPDEPLLAATQAQGVVRKAEYESRTVEATKDFHLMKLVREGDFVISLRSFEGGIEYAHHQGIISPAYTVLIPRDISEARYYRHLLKSRPFIQGLRLFVTGIREGQNIDYTKLSRTFLPCPPVDECNRIANFLDQKTAEIDEAIAKKQRLIELLKEQKTILINRAVTKGLTPDVPMRDSGVEWVGDMPKHWEVKKLKYFSDVQSGITLGKQYGGKNLSNYPYLRVANVQAGFFDLSEIAVLSVPTRVAEQYFVRAGDILITEGGDIDKLGRGMVWENQVGNCLHQNHIFAVRVQLELVSEYFISLALGSDYGRRYFTHTANKTTNLASTNKTKLGNFSVAIPPPQEQQEVLKYSNNVSEEYDGLIRSISSEIEKLFEFKKIAVSETVTGKIKL